MIMRKKELEVFPFVGNNTERNKRIRLALAYSESVSKRKKNRKTEMMLNIVMLIAILLLVGGIFVKALTYENGYYKRTEVQQSNGTYYVYVTERLCVVTDVVGDYVTVAHNGNLYSFFGTDYKVGEQIVCQFTNNWEIVGVTE